MTDAQREYVNGLRELADFFEVNPDLIPKGDGEYICAPVDADQLGPTARRVGGHWTKEARGDDWFRLQRTFGPHRFELFAAREEVCERVVVGQRTVQRPAEDAPLVSVVEDVIEWRCPPSLLAAPDGGPATGGER